MTVLTPPVGPVMGPGFWPPAYQVRTGAGSTAPVEFVVRSMLYRQLDIHVEAWYTGKRADQKSASE